ncbi:putative endonuclease [Geosporobacter subterraneus DSM 17957]|uniref:Putative endonuclease n=1 Tax=Geosporobacter subterraneus DSM 17957 TaxID=1121919 RepID=A0A1M6LK19_9FIRM|nr:GIY-YIG nuclease family protein [Geosporobacter subterraneus]SHJ71544.1 putative endonuclease [Geosporobacter subterraneus DSM 17957]
MYYVYMLANWSNKVIYTGMTNNLERRIYEHKHKLVKGFTEKYNINKLVYFESTTDVTAAILREKQIKGWTRSKKNELIKMMNPQWKDLSRDFYYEDSSLHSE